MVADQSAATVAATVRAQYQAQLRAMVHGDADALGALLADGFTLTHMTGLRQGRAEWLADVRSGAMTYHAVEEVAVSIEPDRERPSVLARTRTEATIWG